MLLAALALAGGGAALIAADGDFANVADALTPFRAGWVAIAFGAQVFAFAGYTLAYRRIIALLDGPRLSPSLVVRLVMTGFGAFAPGGGFAIDYQAVKALEGDERAATVRVLALGALEYVVIAPAACRGRDAHLRQRHAGKRPVAMGDRGPRRVGGRLLGRDPKRGHQPGQARKGVADPR
jgi:hypothetical protein